LNFDCYVFATSAAAERTDARPGLVVLTTDRNKLLELLARTRDAYERLACHHFVIRPAIPILFFGDSEKYFSSPIRIITAGLNPSCKEFPEDDRFKRFPAARDLISKDGNGAGQRHLAALNAYFSTDPYKEWFSCYEPILNGLGCSYYAGRQHTALQTDFCSPIATFPTWRRLSREEQFALAAEGSGNNLWHSLIEILHPDIILISIAERYVRQIKFRPISASEVIWRVDRKNPYDVWAEWVTVHPSKPTLLVFGRAAQKPFGKITNSKKVELGLAIKERYCASTR
jgi:hypothetical protein